jgi:hypothetical protein
VTSSEKGIRNFIDAANQTQYLACARLLFNRTASIAATVAISVDCHRWLNIGNKYEGIIVADA